MVTAILAAKNEANNIKNIINRINNSTVEVEDILVVDGHSTDNTRELAKEEGARVILQSERKYPGKGIAMKDGLEQAEGDVIIYIDSDIKNWKEDWIEKMIQPILDGETEITKAMYDRAPKDAPVTKLVAKPLLKMLFPNLKVKKPLEGELAANKEIFEELDFKENWGVDVGLMISAHLKGFKISNIYLGKKKHKPSYVQDIAELSPMAEDIAHTILDYYGLYIERNNNGTSY